MKFLVFEDLAINIDQIAFAERDVKTNDVIIHFVAPIPKKTSDTLSTSGLTPGELGTGHACVTINGSKADRLWDTINRAI